MSEQDKPGVLIVGATSGIARAVAAAYAARGGRLVLAARDLQSLEEDASDLRVRFGTDVQTRAFDATDAAAADKLLDGLRTEVAVLCHGTMLSNEQARADPDGHRRMIEINYASYALLLEKLADQMQDKGGVIAVLSSVAGDRGRGSNYCYGATKAALTAYADGLRGRLNGTGVHVVTVKPGPVQTAMTAGLPGYEKMAEPARVAKQIVRAIDKRKNVVYTPGKWRLIMAVIRAIPEYKFKKLSI
ncbi:MAG: SDR family oxidoreductase [Phycisphaeraceae bacterium]